LQDESARLLSNQISQGFEHVGSRLDDVVDRLDRVNGSVADAQRQLGSHDARIVAQHVRLDSLSARMKAGGRKITTWDVSLVIGAVAALVAIIEWLTRRQ
jgi:hypothetical protein